MATQRIKLAKGWSSDMPAEEIPPEFQTTMANAFSKNKAVQRAFPFAPVIGQFTDKPRWMLPNQRLGSAFWLTACDASVQVGDGTTIADITPATGWTDHTGIPQPYTGGIIENLPVINSNQDGPYWWEQDIATPSLLQPLPDWSDTDRAASMRPFREFLIAMDITRSGERFPDLFMWSDAAPPGEVPQSWTADTNSAAGEASVAFYPGQLVDGRQLLDRFYLYKTTSTFVLSLVGGQFVFNQRPVFSTIGLLAKQCVVEWRGQHVCLTDGDLVIHDGLNVRSIAKERLRRVIFDNLNGDSFDNSFLFYSDSLNAIGICRPTGGNEYPVDAILLSMDDLTFGHQRLISTGTPHAFEGLVDDSDTGEDQWDEKTTLWSNDPTRWNEGDFARIADHVLATDYEGLQLDQLGVGNDQGGTDLTAVVERQSIPFGDMSRRKFVRRVWPRFKGAIGNVVLVTMGGQEHADSDPAWGDEQTFIIGQDRWVTVNVSAFYLAYRIRSIGGLAWELPSLDLDIEMGGRY